MSSNKPAYMVLTWGCQMNEDDSRQMSSLLEQMGYELAASEADADVILLNTCSVRAKPEQKVRTKLGELRLLKQERPDLIIGVCGCMAQREGKEILRSRPFINLVLGTANIYELPSLIAEIKQGRRKILAIDLPDRDGSTGESHVPRLDENVGVKAFVPAMFGCNNFCTYCVVPYVRGPERSRPPREIIEEAKSLVSRGAKEIMLVGQNVNSYGRTLDESIDFAGILEQLNGVSGLERIRFMTSHPKDLSDRLIDAICDLPKVCEHLHLPIQAGDDEILRRMGRGYTVDHYRSLIDKLRSRLPEIALTTDVMVGFPGETEEQFANTLRMISAVQYDAAYMFEFNARPGTKALEMPDQLDHKTKIRRLGELIELQNSISIARNRSEAGTVVEVLVESASQKHSDRMCGFTRRSKMVNFPGEPELIGKLVKVRTAGGGLSGFVGEMVKE